MSSTASESRRPGRLASLLLELTTAARLLSVRPAAPRRRGGVSPPLQHRLTEPSSHPRKGADTSTACRANGGHSDSPRRTPQGHGDHSPACSDSRRRPSQGRRAATRRHTPRHTPSTPCLDVTVHRSFCIRGHPGRESAGIGGHTPARRWRRLQRRGGTADLRGIRAFRTWAGRRAGGRCPRRRSPLDTPGCRPSGKAGHTTPSHVRCTAIEERRHSLCPREA